MRVLALTSHYHFSIMITNNFSCQTWYTAALEKDKMFLEEKKALNSVYNFSNLFTILFLHNISFNYIYSGAGKVWSAS